jgi:hypothetical protein
MNEFICSSHGAKKCQLFLAIPRRTLGFSRIVKTDDCLAERFATSKAFVQSAYYPMLFAAFFSSFVILHASTNPGISRRKRAELIMPGFGYFSITLLHTPEL